ncbi:hypothetical protein AVEN_174791-1 [Araneus ventricosus]|uniref:Tc1-like transposase DDE domain-containing protein n=1 Tax=Araneus ventricosus TaxID=182803 RepID=A0A4Y2WM61_ARAVE|nr:hypothetical protein AVEN_244355-1 [Araneus ventricosus]GBO37047.1 hypothetical protein AVEN_174791-1 [Araneus ventricosus]
MLSDGVILLLHNSRSHNPRKTQEFLQKFKWEVWSPTPPLIQPRNGRQRLFPFWKLKEHLSGTRFSSDSDVKTAAENWLKGQGRDFYRTRSCVQINA